MSHNVTGYSIYSYKSNLFIYSMLITWFLFVFLMDVINEQGIIYLSIYHLRGLVDGLTGVFE